jgi:hypothetical protein
MQPSESRMRLLTGSPLFVFGPNGIDSDRFSAGIDGCLLSGPLRRDGKHDRCCAIYHRPVRDLFLRRTVRLWPLTAAGKWRNSNWRHFGEESEIIRSNWLIWCHQQPQMKRLRLWDVVSTLHTSVCLMVMRTVSLLRLPFHCNCILFAALFATRFPCYGGPVSDNRNYGFGLHRTDGRGALPHTWLLQLSCQRPH